LQTITTVIVIVLIIIISFVFAILIDLNSLKIVNKKTRYVLLFISSLVMTMSYSYAYLGNAGGVNADVEHGDAPVFYAEKLASELQSDLYRVKDLSNYQYENKVFNNKEMFDKILKKYSKGKF